MHRIITLLLLLLPILNFAQDAGMLDTNFGQSGFVIETEIETGGGIAIMPDDRIVMVGGNNYFSAARFLADGTLDTTFGTAGKVTVAFTAHAHAFDVAVQPDGKVVIVGEVEGENNDYYFAVVRLTADGVPDISFNTNGIVLLEFDESKNRALAVAIQPDGKIVATGRAGEIGAQDFALARLNDDGSLDTDFGEGGKQLINFGGDDRSTGVGLLPDGKIVVGGSIYPSGSNTSWFGVARLDAAGNLDDTFSSDGLATAKVGQGNDTAYDLAIQPDGKIIVAGDSWFSDNGQDFGAVRFTTDGILDTTFSGDGKFRATVNATTDYCTGIALQPDGKILLLGSFSAMPERKLAILRLTNGGELDVTFSDDGKASVEVPGDNGVSTFDVAMQSTGQIIVSGYAQNDYMLARFFSGTELGVDHWNAEAVSFYPNPARQTITFNEAMVSAAVYALDGRLILNRNVAGSQLDVSALSKGIYLLQAVSLYGISEKKLVIE